MDAEDSAHTPPPGALSMVEQNMLEQFRIVSRSPVVRRDPAEDVLAFHSEFPLAMFNFIGDARFASGNGVNARARTESILDDYLDRGRNYGIPFLWWPTPSTSNPAMIDQLMAAGLQADASTGMYCALGEPKEVGLASHLHVEMGAPMEDFGLAMATGFEVDEQLAPLLGAMYSVFSPAQMLKAVVRDADMPVASGALFMTDDVAGVYALAVRPDYRRQGIASALTTTLTNIAVMHGARHAVLHTTEESHSLFDSLGYAVVCDMPQYSWYP